MPHHAFAVVSEIAGQHQKSFRVRSNKINKSNHESKIPTTGKEREGTMFDQINQRQKNNHPHGKMCKLQMEQSEIPTVFLTRRQSQELFRCGKRCKPWHRPRLWNCSLTLFPFTDGRCESSHTRQLYYIIYNLYIYIYIMCIYIYYICIIILQVYTYTYISANAQLVRMPPFSLSLQPGLQGKSNAVKQLLLIY